MLGQNTYDMCLSVALCAGHGEEEVWKSTRIQLTIAQETVEPNASGTNKL